MIRRLLLTTAAVVVAGSFALPAAASSAPAFSLTLYPAKIVIPLGQTSVTFGLLNSGTSPQRIEVAPAAAWLIPDVKTFDVAPGQTHMTQARIALPAVHDSGDVDTTMVFSAVPIGGGNGKGTIQVRGGVAAVVIVSTNVDVLHGLRIGGLTVPPIADSWDAPVVNLTLDNSRGNVHELVSIPPFGETLLLRGQTRTVSLQWKQHPLIGLASITAASQHATTLFFPVRAAAGVVVILGLVLIAGVVRRRRVKA